MNIETVHNERRVTLNYAININKRQHKALATACSVFADTAQRESHSARQASEHESACVRRQSEP